MKPVFYLAIELAILFTLLPSPAQDNGYVVTGRGPDYNVLQKVVVQNGVTNVHSYTAFGTGLNYTNSHGQWVPAQEQIAILPGGGAAATQGRHQIYFPGDLP